MKTLLLSLVSIPLLCGQSMPVPGLRVLQVKYTPSELQAQADLVNDGTSTIAAYELSVTTTLADGQELRGSLARDATQMIFDEALFSKMPGVTMSPEGRPFQPGQHLTEHVFATTSGSELKPVSLRCGVLYVIFADGTEAGDPQRIRHQRTTWSAELKSIEKWLPELMKLGDSLAPTSGDFKKFWERVSADPMHAGLFGGMGMPQPKDSPFDSVAVPVEGFRKALASFHDAFQERETLLRKLTETPE
jgi:hypothetical protein